MKIRSGFVSNSSSSSFLIIGTTDSVYKIAEKVGLLNDDDEYSNWTENENIVDAGYGGAELAGKRFSDAMPYVFYGSWDEPYYFGIDAEGLLELGERVPDLKELFIKKVKEDFDIDLSNSEVKLHFGECEM